MLDADVDNWGRVQELRSFSFVRVVVPVFHTPKAEDRISHPPLPFCFGFCCFTLSFASPSGAFFLCIRFLENSLFNLNPFEIHCIAQPFNFSIIILWIKDSVYWGPLQWVLKKTLRAVAAEPWVLRRHRLGIRGRNSRCIARCLTESRNRILTRLVFLALMISFGFISIAFLLGTNPNSAWF